MPYCSNRGVDSNFQISGRIKYSKNGVTSGAAPTFYPIESQKWIDGGQWSEYHKAKEKLWWIIFSSSRNTIVENNIYSLEHVVPQSIFKKKYFNYTRDMHNIILYPLKMNNHRSNYKYVDENMDRTVNG